MELFTRVREGIENIQPYVPGLSDDELKEKYGLQEVIKLNANENALGPSKLALEAIAKELPFLHHYPDGSSEILRHAIANFHGVSTENVFVGNGSDDIIKLISETFLEDGDEIVVPHPSFSQYEFGAQIMRAKVVRVPLKADFTYDVDALLGAVTEQTKLLYVCSPNNPTGTILKHSELETLARRLPKHVILIVDLAYNDYTDEPTRAVEAPEILADERTVFLHTFSKLYGLAGLRVGYGIANASVWSWVNRVREPFNVNRVAQRAAVAALEDEAHRENSRHLAEQSFHFYKTACAELGLECVHSEANFILIKTSNGVETMKSMMTRGVMVRAGFAGLAEYIRVTYGTEEENRRCLEALVAALGLERVSG